MKLSFISASLALVLGAHVQAQFQSYGIPSCATACVEQAALQGHCGFSDIGCICNSLENPDVLRTAVMCESHGCSETKTMSGGETVPSAIAQFFVQYCSR